MWTQIVLLVHGQMCPSLLISTVSMKAAHLLFKLLAKESTPNWFWSVPEGMTLVLRVIGSASKLLGSSSWKNPCMLIFQANHSVPLSFSSSIRKMVVIPACFMSYFENNVMSIKNTKIFWEKVLDLQSIVKMSHSQEYTRSGR